MKPLLPTRLSRISLRTCLWGIALAGAASLASAQGPTPSLARSYERVDPSLARIANAMSDLRLEVVGERIVHDASGEWGFSERVFFEGAPTRRFAPKLVEILGGATLPPQEVAARARKYDNHASFLQQYSGFRISDPALASSNYRYLQLFSGSYLNRTTVWAAVIPEVRDRSAWLLQLDSETGYPLYQGEYNVQGRLATEYRVTTFRPGIEAQIPATVAWWQTTNYSLKDYAASEAAVAALTTGATSNTKGPIVAMASDLPRGYELAISRVTTFLLNGEKTLVFDYSDGIDHLFVSERITSNPEPPASAGHQILLYSDMSATECKFECGGIEVLAIGRGNREVVKDLAKALYARAIARG